MGMLFTVSHTDIHHKLSTDNPHPLPSTHIPYPTPRLQHVMRAARVLLGFSFLYNAHAGWEIGDPATEFSAAWFSTYAEDGVEVRHTRAPFSSLLLNVYSTILSYSHFSITLTPFTPVHSRSQLLLLVRTVVNTAGRRLFVGISTGNGVAF